MKWWQEKFIEVVETEMEGSRQMLAIAESRDTWYVWSVFVAVNAIHIHFPKVLSFVLITVVS